MSQFIAFDAAQCFNEIGRWLIDVTEFRPPTFEDFVETVWARTRRATVSDWEKERKRFESGYESDPNAWNREYCEKLDARCGPYMRQRGWRVAFARTNRVAMYLNNGDVHALKTEPDYLWERLPRFWAHFDAIRCRAGLSSPTPPWQMSGGCALPLIPEDDLRVFEAEVIELADEFELLRRSDSLCFAVSREDWEPEGAVWIVPTYPLRYPVFAEDNERCCRFEFVPIPPSVRLENRIWDEATLRYYAYLKCKKCGAGALYYHPSDWPNPTEAVAKCNPNCLEALHWQAQRQDKLLETLATFRNAWECIENRTVMARRAENANDNSDRLPSYFDTPRAIRLASTLLCDAEDTLMHLAKDDSRARSLLPLARDLLKQQPGAWDNRLSFDPPLTHEFFRREQELLQAAIPAEKLAAIPPPLNFDDLAPDKYGSGSELASEGDVGTQCAAPVENGNGTDRRRAMSREEANWRARDILRKDPEITVRELARRIGCSTGLVSQLVAYRVVREKLDAGEQPGKPKMVSLTDDLLAVTGRDDAELKRLIEEQQADREASPLEEDEPGKPRRVYRPK